VNGGSPRWRLHTSNVLAAVLLVATIRPAAAGVAEDAQALVERAAAHISEVGRTQAFADITRPDGGFVKGELYVFCDARDGTTLAHGGNPKQVGKVMLGVHDEHGTAVIAEVFRLGQTQGRGWLEYTWPNPSTGRIQRKATYVLKIDDQTVCGSGYYKPGSP
jgi:cytochrome c